jgi:hypothetical protein
MDLYQQQKASLKGKRQYGLFATSVTPVKSKSSLTSLGFLPLKRRIVGSYVAKVEANKRA